MEPEEELLLRACRRQPVARTPVWFMRQAGRSLPEYHRARAGRSLLEAVAEPQLAAELTVQPVRRYGVDAAILFSDIVVPLVAVGVPFEIVPGRGPVLERPFSGQDDLRRLRALEPASDLGHVIETVALVVNELDVPLIGFAGAPFTLASYLVEGGPSRSFGRTKALMYREPRAFDELSGLLASISLASLRAQAQAGAKALQLFDSWVGVLSEREYERFALPWTRLIMAGLDDLGVPRILFGVGAGELLSSMATSGADVIGVDWRVPLSEASRRVGGALALQGNLDPALCLAGAEVAARAVEEVMCEAAGLPGHVFNLGHGVLPETDPGVLAHVVDLVHAGRPPMPTGPLG